MRRALQLARNGEGHVAPNPMVGAVITAPDGRIIGEGYHAEYGKPHAEVNAVASVKKVDIHLLREATIYVTLEPCAHFGKTPPCANLLVEKNFRRVVIASSDPNPKVAGKGVKILRDAGIDVTEGVLRKEADDLNKRFMTFHLKKRPWILLKWAQSADGFMATKDENGNPKGVRFSNQLSQLWMHKERAAIEAIMVGSNTKIIDQPRLDCRLWKGRNPEIIDCCHHIDLDNLMRDLYERNISSLMVEGGRKLLDSFIHAGLYDEIRVETSHHKLGQGLKAPALPENIMLLDSFSTRGNLIVTYRHL